MVYICSLMLNPIRFSSTLFLWSFVLSNSSHYIVRARAFDLLDSHLVTFLDNYLFMDSRQIPFSSSRNLFFSLGYSSYASLLFRFFFESVATALRSEKIQLRNPYISLAVYTPLFPANCLQTTSSYSFSPSYLPHESMTLDVTVSFLSTQAMILSFTCVYLLFSLSINKSLRWFATFVSNLQTSTYSDLLNLRDTASRP